MSSSQSVVSHSSPPNEDRGHAQLHALEAERQRRNNRQRERRRLLSSSQQEESLARRRANYQRQQQMEATSVSNQVEAMAGVEQQNHADHQSTPHFERENQRARWRTSQSIWRASMSSIQRDEYLARRRANYHCHRGQTSNHEDNTQVPNRIRLSHMRQLARSNGIQVPGNGANQNDTNNGDHIAVNEATSENSRMRLSHIRQLARSNRSQMPNSGVNQNATNNEDHIVLNEGTSENVIPQNSMTYNNSVVQVHLRARGRRSHNCARNFHENIGITKYHLPAPKICPHCHARQFYHESKDMCCLNGKIVIPPVQSPPEMAELFSAETPRGAHFRRNIRAYNHVFSFTSMGVHVDQNLATGGGTFTFRAQGSIYHKIGTLLPNEDNRPRFLQLYIYDTDHELQNRMLENESLHRDVVETIQEILNRHNPFVRTLHHLAQREDLETCRLIIREQPANQRQYSLPTESQVAAVIVGADDAENLRGRDIVVQTREGQLLNVQDCAGYYDPLQYPLLLPYGTYGWDVNSRNNNGTKLTCRDYYAYILQIRPHDESILLRGGRLLQQYVVDNYVKIETQKLRWIRSNQDTLRRELYNGLQDSLNAGENNAGNIGRRTILPSSFIGSPRDMHQRYQDAMALVQKYGKPDIFLTMTCNPNWEEIKAELLPGQVAQDRPDLCTRIFRAKFEELKEDVIKKGVLGTVVAHVYVIEFQKRGLPHVHMLLMLNDDDKLNNPDDYDKIVRAEIPSQDEEPELYNVVLRHMIHGPCGVHKRNAPCMKRGSCKRGYPKPFSANTFQGNDSYPIYRRRDVHPNAESDFNQSRQVDNSWVIPYNPWLLTKYDCHINVEVCCSIKSVKYLYKYVYKGPDRVTFEVRPEANEDEIRNFVDARWVCAPEALWRIFKFVMNRMYPSVRANTYIESFLKDSDGLANIRHGRKDRLTK
ncbi:hypothetical protein ABKV19_002737, partial [Rosa sericea]